MSEILQNKIFLHSLQLARIIMEVDQESREYKAIGWSPRSFGKRISLIKPFLIVNSHLNESICTELMNFLCDFGFSTIEKAFPAPALTRAALINCVP